MSDIFDEVDEILNEVESVTSAKDDADLVENNFNESELEDIMAEIEGLEKEFENEVIPESKISSTPVFKEVKQTNLQNEIDRELELSLKMRDEALAPKVLSLEPKASSEISFEAHGQMKLHLDFKIGEESAKLSIDPIKGLMITMSGAELCINQADGCKVTTDSGVKFTIPLTSPQFDLKKKSA